jgi:hypothetical protein
MNVNEGRSSGAAGFDSKNELASAGVSARGMIVIEKGEYRANTNLTGKAEPRR